MKRGKRYSNCFTSFQCTLISLHKLSRFIDVSQLPDTLGGTLHYDPYSWTLLRQVLYINYYITSYNFSLLSIFFSHTNMFKKLENYVNRANNWIESSKRRDNMTSNQSDEKISEEDNFNSNELLKAGKNLRQDQFL